MSAGDQNYSRAAKFKCLSDPTVPLSVWIVPITAARPFIGFHLEQRMIANKKGGPKAVHLVADIIAS